MSFLELLKTEFIKVKRSKMIPLLFIAPLLVVAWQTCKIIFRQNIQTHGQLCSFRAH